MQIAPTLLALFLSLAALRAASSVSDLDPDESIVFAPAPGRVLENGAVIEATISGIVYELEPRRFTLGLLKKTLGLAGTDLNPDQERIFKERGRLFLVDHERRKSVVIRLGSQIFDLGRTGPDGWFSRQIRYATPGGAAPPFAFVFSAVLREPDHRVFEGRCFVQAPGGLVVVSDIDDTIKVTGVTDRSKMLKNTFLEPYRAVPGMASLYQQLAARGAMFHYVSASPWQLFTSLQDFCRTNQFPDGIFHLKSFRFKDRSFFSLFQDPEEYKTPVLEQLIREAPDSQFILIGDAGEKDPEIYSALARKYPRRIQQILILAPEPQEGRYAQLAAGLPTGCLVFFADPSRLPPPR